MIITSDETCDVDAPEGGVTRTYIITTSRITSCELSNQRNGLGGGLRRGIRPA